MCRLSTPHPEEVSMSTDALDLEGGCDFLIDNIGKAPIKKLVEHLADCEDCVELLDMSFNSYVKLGTDLTDPICQNIEFPEGITSKEKFLEVWHLGISRRDEVREHLWDSLDQKLATKRVKYQLEKIRQRSVRCIEASLNLQPPVFLEQHLTLLAESYKELRDMLGHREFSMHMTDDTEMDLDRHLAWWRRAILAHHEPKNSNAS